MNKPTVAYCNKLLLFLLPTCLGISYSTAWRFTFKPGARAPPPPRKKSRRAHFAASANGAENASYTPLDDVVVALRAVSDDDGLQTVQVAAWQAGESDVAVVQF